LEKRYIDSSIHAYRDSGDGAVRIGSNGAHDEVHVESDESDPARRRHRPHRMCRLQRAVRAPTPSSATIRTRDLEREYLELRRLGAPSVGRESRRGRAGLLPAAGVGDGAALGLGLPTSSAWDGKAPL